MRIRLLRLCRYVRGLAAIPRSAAAVVIQLQPYFRETENFAGQAPRLVIIWLIRWIQTFEQTVVVGFSTLRVDATIYSSTSTLSLATAHHSVAEFRLPIDGAINVAYCGLRCRRSLTWPWSRG